MINKNKYINIFITISLLDYSLQQIRNNKVMIIKINILIYFKMKQIKIKINKNKIIYYKMIKIVSIKKNKQITKYIKRMSNFKNTNY